MLSYSKVAKSKVTMFIVTLLLLELVSGCSSAPSENEAKTVLENETKTSFKLNSFKKTNGESGVESGVKIYTLYYEAEVECLKRYLSPSISCYKGDLIKIGGYLKFRKMEKGWNAVDGSMKEITQ